ncbi:MAG: DNA strand exchange inhibitor protein [Isosphaeraceae bacterium]|nr:DNA strand exchange inhibitor protein [Isosphaeraceae bacterium]
MDSHTLELLEFEKIRRLVAGYAACSLGKSSAAAMEPSLDVAWIRRAQALTSEMADALSAGLSPPFGGLHDIRPQVRRAQTGATLTIEELSETVESLLAIDNLESWLDRVAFQFPRLGGLKSGVGRFTDVVNSIQSCLDSRGAILDTASRKLSNIRGEIGQVESRIQETLKRMLRSPEIKRILRYPNFTMVGHHYVLPIAKDHRGEIQGSVHRTSSSNETVFVEPQAIAEQSAQLSYLRAKEAKEIKRILRWLSAQIGQVAGSLLTTLEVLAELDLVFARGRYSLDFRMSPPDLNEEGRISLRGARHPLLESLFRIEARTSSESKPSAETEPAEGSVEPTTRGPAPAPRSVTPIDIHLGFRFSMLIVTGPNTGGKTVALKTVGLLVAMAQSGLHIPAHQGSQLPICDDVLADIGDEQSLEQSLSTFSSHIRRISTILSKAKESSLVLLDELGAGTDPAEGAALGRSILDELDSIGCRAIVTTHIGDLKTYAFSNPRAENAAVEFDLESMRPMYHVHIGDIGQSNALQIARRLALPEHLVERGFRYLKETRGAETPELEIIQKLRKEAEDARKAALESQAEAERLRELYGQKLADLQVETENEAKIAEARERLQPGDRVVIPKMGYDRPGRVVKLDPRKKTAVVAIGAMQWNVNISELIPQVSRMPEAPKSGGKSALPRLDQFRDVD